MGRAYERGRGEGGGARLTVAALAVLLMSASACGQGEEAARSTTDLQVHVLVLQKSQRNCARLADQFLDSWRRLIFDAEASYDEFPPTMAAALPRETARIEARKRYLRESLDLLRGRLRPSTIEFLEKLEIFHVSTCQGVIEPGDSFHRYHDIAKHGTKGFTAAWRRRPDVLKVPKDDARRLAPRVDELLAEIDEWAIERDREERRDRLREQRRQREAEEREWQEFLEAQEELRERKAARRRALRERRFSDERADGGRERPPRREER